MIKAIFAIDDFNGIGYLGKLPWPKITEDLQLFKQYTKNQVVVMGRKTWDSEDMPRPLPSRINAVITNRQLDIPGVITLNGDVIASIQLLQKNYPEKDVYIIGGAETLIQTHPIIETVYISRIQGKYMADTTLCLDNFLKSFSLINETIYDNFVFLEFVKDA